MQRNTQPFNDDLTNKIAEFLLDIGIEVVACTIKQETFLSGILVSEGRLLVDQSRLTHPLDLLHEAGSSRCRAGLNQTNTQWRSSVTGRRHDWRRA